MGIIPDIFNKRVEGDGNDHLDLWVGEEEEDGLGENQESKEKQNKIRDKYRKKNSGK